MKITNITVWRENLELTRPYTIAYKTISTVENAFVRIDLTNGVYGVGACNPSKPVVGESLDDAYTLLSTPSTTEWLVGRDIRTMQGLCREVQQRFAQSAGTRAALDIALHDAFARFLGLPLVDVLGRSIKSLPTSITIGIKGVQETLDEAQEYVERKFSVIKVKTGASLEEDIERLTKLRERYGNTITIRIDSNQGYTAAQMVEFFRRTQPLNIELNEQPLPTSDEEGLRSLPEEIRTTIAADESLVSPDDALRLVHTPRACGIFNIKLMKCGGVSKALDIARVAELADVKLMWGCNDESIVSIAAALHAAFASPQTKYIDLDGSLDLARDAVSGGFILENGIMRPTDAPGLGVELLSQA
jgi:L-alanine-DL-glutamate epimerase-like enolase superfamily enzyme